MHKIIITPNEVAALLGVSESYGRRIIREIKEKLGGKKYITYQNFADHYGFKLKEVLEGIKQKSFA